MYYIVQNFWLAYVFDAVIGATAGWLFYKFFSEYRRPGPSSTASAADAGEPPAAQVLQSDGPTLAAELLKYRDAYQQISDERIALDAEWQKRYRLYKEFCDDRIAVLEAETALLRSKPTDEERAQLYDQIGTSLADKEHWRALYQASEDQLALLDQEAAELRSKVSVIDALEKDRALLKSQIAQWAVRFAEQGRELAECQKQIEALTSDAQVLPEEPPVAEDWSYLSDDTIRMKLAAAQAEITQLRSHLSTASFLQDQWRRRWRDMEQQLKQAQQPLADVPTQTPPPPLLQDRTAPRDSANGNSCNYPLLHPVAQKQRATA